MLCMIGDTDGGGDVGTVSLEMVVSLPWRRNVLLLLVGRQGCNFKILEKLLNCLFMLGWFLCIKRASFIAS